MKTLDELNATPRTWIWSGREVVTTYAVGKMGRAWSAGPKTGMKLHLITVDTFKDTGKVFSMRAMCNGNGQFTGLPFKGIDTDRITCQHCGY